MATSWPKSLDTVFGGCETLAERVSKLTDGKFSIRPFTGGIVPAKEIEQSRQLEKHVPEHRRDR